MTQFIVVANSKGGVGKTTVSILLAEFLKKKYGKKTLLIDADNDQHSIELAKEAGVLVCDTIAISSVDEYNDIDINGYDFVISDTSPHSHYEEFFYEIASDADLIITVLKPAPHDFLAYSKIMENLLNTLSIDRASQGLNKQHQVILLNQVQTIMSNVQKESIEEIRKIKSAQALDSKLSLRAYFSSFGFDSERQDSKAEAEVISVIEELKTRKLIKI